MLMTGPLRTQLPSGWLPVISAGLVAAAAPCIFSKVLDLPQRGRLLRRPLCRGGCGLSRGGCRDSRPSLLIDRPAAHPNSIVGFLVGRLVIFLFGFLVGRVREVWVRSLDAGSFFLSCSAIWRVISTH